MASLPTQRVSSPSKTSIKPLSVLRKDLPRIRGTRGSTSKSTTTKSAWKWNVPTFRKTSSATPTGREIKRSTSSRVIHVGDSSGRESFLHIDNGMRFMLASRSVRDKHSSILGKSHGMRNLPGYLSFSGFDGRAKLWLWSTNKRNNGLNDGSNNGLIILDWIFNLDNRRLDVSGASVISRRHRILCHLGLTFYYFWKRRRVMVLHGRVPEPEDEASQLAVEESGADEPELGNPRLDKLKAG
nr:hypothetical protein [Tanacetum cinerariifolium]